MTYLLRVREILRQIRGSDVAVIAILRSSPKINGVRPAANVADQESSSDKCNHVSPKTKMVASPSKSAGNEVLNF
jgi:hypothetical protein